MAAFIAMELGFNIPAPCIVNISPEFAEVMRGEPNFASASQSIGYNFGNEYIKEGYQTLLRDQKIPPELRIRLQELFAFDILIGNADRRLDKPNFLTNGRQELIFDHELAFGFTLLLPLLRTNEPWILGQHDIEWIRDNYCYDVLKGSNIDFSIFVSKFSALNAHFWQCAWQHIPAGWQTGQLVDIQQHIETIVHHRDVFKTELNRILR